MTELADLERALLTALGTITEHWNALLEPTTGSGVASKPTPRNLYTLDDDDERSHDLPNTDRRIALRDDVTFSLNGWALVIIKDRNLTHHLPLATDTIGLIEFLQRWARWFSGHEAAEAAADELTALAGMVRATAFPERREWMPLGSCPLEIETDTVTTVCGGQVRAHPGREPQCERCGTSGVATWWERVMFPDAETARLVTADEIVTLVHRQFGRVIKPGTVRVWINRGWIEPSGTDDKGRTLYDKGAVVYAYAKRNAG